MVVQLALARRGSPLRVVRLLLEIGARDELLLQVLRVVDNGRDDEPVTGIWLLIRV
jgi:hypothetical protein